jgi:hypothetical protein
MSRIKRVGWLFAIALLTAGCAATSSQVVASPDIRVEGGVASTSGFYDALAPYGTWIDYASYGWCWTPYDVSSDWRPYSNGNWIYSDYGWTWNSNEPWGWATYHYGRWLFDASYGWVWVPGEQWAPAWVAWRESDDWVGWAPLPPSASWGVSVGLQFGDVASIPARNWCFVESRHLPDPNVRVQFVSVVRNENLLVQTRDVTHFEVRESRPVNRGVDVAVIERQFGQRVPRVRIVDAASPATGHGQAAGSGTVAFFRPPFKKGDTDVAPRPEVRQDARPGAMPVTQDVRDREQKRLESSLAQERQQLEREHQNEMRKAAAGSAANEIRARQEVERQAFEKHAAEQRQLLSQRLQRKLVRGSNQSLGKHEAKDDKGSHGSQHG